MRESNDEQSYIEQEYGNELDSDTYLKYDNGSGNKHNILIKSI